MTWRDAIEKLAEVRYGRSYKIRLRAFKELMKKDVDEKVLFIVSLMVEEIHTIPAKPKFNLKPDDDILACVHEYINSDMSKRSFNSMPYVVQRLLTYGRACEQIRLSTEDVLLSMGEVAPVISVIAAFPPTTHIKKPRVIENDFSCALCSEEAERDGICNYCRNALIEKVGFRNDSFILTLKPDTFSRFTEMVHNKPFKFRIDGWNIERSSEYAICFWTYYTKPTQLVLEFEEYQHKLS